MTHFNIHPFFKISFAKIQIMKSNVVKFVVGIYFKTVFLYHSHSIGVRGKTCSNKNNK